MTGTLCKCKKVNDVSAKRSNPCSGVHSRCSVRYAVGVSAKRSTHTVDLVNMGGGEPLSAKREWVCSAQLARSMH